MKIELLRRPRLARLRQMAVGGTASIAVNVVATNMLRIVSSMTLTRLLDTHAFGVVGVITSVAYMIEMLSDVGLYNFVVRHKDGDNPRFLNQVWTIRLVRGIMLMLVMMAISRPAAALLDKPELALVLAIWSVSFLIDGLSSMTFAIAPRQQMLWRLSTMELIANLCGLIASIVGAVITRSYWALIGGMLFGSIVKAALSYLIFPGSGRRWNFNFARSQELWRWSRFIAMSSILSLVILQSDKLVLARMMPLATFGLYAIATTLAATPGMLATQYATRVLYGAYSHTVRTNPAALGEVLYAARRKVLLLYMFGVGGLIGGAPLLIEILYDPRYRGVAPFLQLLAIAPLLRMSVLSANEAMLALGYTRSTFMANLFRITWLAIGGAIGLATGHIMLLVATVGTIEVPGLLCFWWNLRRRHLLNLREESYGLIAGAIGVGTGWVVARLGMMLITHL